MEKKSIQLHHRREEMLLSLALSLVVASHAGEWLGVVWETMTNEWFDSGQTSSQGTNDSYGREKETMTDEKPINEKISP